LFPLEKEFAEQQQSKKIPGAPSFDFSDHVKQKKEKNGCLKIKNHTQKTFAVSPPPEVAVGRPPGVAGEG